MSNILDNGTVLPYGLLGIQGPEAAMAAFNRSYRNTGIKAGIVVNTYPSNDPLNLSKICTEYDVVVMEQFENKGSTSILYKNCLSSQGFGSLADYFEMVLRHKTVQTTKGFPTFKNQDGAIALIQCLDNAGDKAIVIGNLIHPDRETNVVSKDPQLFGEYNGVNVQIAPDGSCMLTFKGATDNEGAPIDPSQGNTVLKIEKDGSFQFNHSTVTIRADRSGTATVIATKDVIVNCTNATVTATNTATVEGKTVKLGKAASESVVKGDTFKKLFDQHFHPTPIGPSGPPTLPLDPIALSKKCVTE